MSKSRKIEALILGHTLSVEGVGISVPQVLSGSQGANSVVAVGTVLVGGAGDLAQVGHLVQGGGLLVLGVAGAAGGGQAGEVQGAVDHVALGGQGVGQDTALAAVAVDVGAVVVGDTGAGAAALRDDTAEDGGDLAAGRGRGGLEVLLELGGRARGGGGRGSRSKATAVGHRVDGGGAAGAGAVGVDGRALDGALDELLADLLGLGAVDGGGNLVAGVGDGTGDGGGALLSVGDGTLREDVEGTTLGEVVCLGDVELDLDALAGGNALEGLLIQVLGGHAETDALESNTGLCSRLALRFVV